MSSDEELELFKQYKSAQDKYRYFLLAAAASAIGFAMTQTKTEILSLCHIPLGLAIVSWAVSFYSGMQFLEYAMGVTFQNHNYLSSKRELKAFVKDEHALSLTKKMKEGFYATTQKQGARMKIYGNLQSWLLLLGAMLYIFWHALRMHSAVT